MNASIEQVASAGRRYLDTLEGLRPSSEMLAVIALQRLSLDAKILEAALELENESGMEIDVAADFFASYATQHQLSPDMMNRVISMARGTVEQFLCVPQSDHR